MNSATANNDMAVQGLIDGYLDSVRQVLERSRLHSGEATSILDDVRTQILETLAARAHGAPTPADAEAVPQPVSVQKDVVILDHSSVHVRRANGVIVEAKHL